MRLAPNTAGYVVHTWGCCTICRLDVPWKEMSSESKSPTAGERAQRTMRLSTTGLELMPYTDWPPSALSTFTVSGKFTSAITGARAVATHAAKEGAAVV